MRPFYHTRLGEAFLGDALDVLHGLVSESVNLIVTSPPFPLTFQKKKPYSSVRIDEYIAWFLPIADECKRVLTEDGSFVVDIGGVWNKGVPTRSLYQYYLLLALHDKVGFHFAQDFYWYNPGALPAPKADNHKVLKEYSPDMLRLLQRGYRAKARPSGHTITAKFTRDHGGAIPSNLIEFGNNDSNGEYLKRCQAAGLPVHPARFPRGLPEFFIKLCTDPNDLVLDIFAGSNITGEAAEHLDRRWIAIELAEEYLEGSKFRFPPLFLMQAARSRTH